jgi:hypothetical protein
VQRKLTDEVIHADRAVLSYPCTKRPDKRWWFEGTVDLENHHHFVRHYDLQRPRRESLRLKRLADLLIHSFVFVVWPEEGGTFEDARVFFNSDRNQVRVVYEMQVAAFSAIRRPANSNNTTGSGTAATRSPGSMGEKRGKPASCRRARSTD